MLRWIRQMQKKGFSTPPPSVRKTTRQSTRLTLEVLEDRTVPSTLTVTSTADSGFGTLRAEVALAQTGDTVVFSSALNNRTVNLQSEIQMGVGQDGQPNGVTNVTIDASNVNVTLNGQNSTRMFEIVAGNDTINGLTFANGEASGVNALINGGAILVDNGATLNLNSDTFNSNSSQAAGGGNGGAIENDGTLNDSNSAYINNSAPYGYGGAIYNTGILNESAPGSTDFYDNSALNGGAIASKSGGTAGQLNVADAYFVGDTATNYGGAIYTSDETTLNSDIFGGGPTLNSAGSGGGAVAALGGTNGTTKLTVNNSTFTANEVTSTPGTGYGGAIDTTAITDVEQSTFSNNAVRSDTTHVGSGGAVYYAISNQGTAFDSTLELNQDTFTQNSAADGGGVASLVQVNSGTITQSVTNSTFTLNTAANNGQGLGAGMDFTQQTSGSGTANVSFINDTLFNNTSDNWGGGLLLALNNSGTGANTATLTSLTVNQNTAAAAGGGILLETAKGTPASAVSLNNNILDGNTVSNSNFKGTVDLTLQNGATFTDKGCNLVGTNDADLFQLESDPKNDNPGLAPSLAPNGAAPGYPETLALLVTSPGYETGDQTLPSLPFPWKIDERGLTRQFGEVSIGAEDPDAR